LLLLVVLLLLAFLLLMAVLLLQASANPGIPILPVVSKFWTVQ
jgi:hypothetical protein